jgi:putative transposase
VRRSHPFEIDAIVILPDHLHAVWTLPQDDADFALLWRQIKSAFSRSLPIGERVSESRADKAERGIWQRRYWEHTLRDEADFAQHVDYIHFNPMKHRHVTLVRDWPYSSFHRGQAWHLPARLGGRCSGQRAGFRGKMMVRK